MWATAVAHTVGPEYAALRALCQASSRRGVGPATGSQPSGFTPGGRARRPACCRPSAILPSRRCCTLLEQSTRGLPRRVRAPSHRRPPGVVAPRSPHRGRRALHRCTDRRPRQAGCRSLAHTARRCEVEPAGDSSGPHRSGRLGGEIAIFVGRNALSDARGCVCRPAALKWP